MLTCLDHGVASCHLDGIDHGIMTLTDAEFDEHYTGDFEVTNAISCIAACLLVRSCI